MWSDFEARAKAEFRARAEMAVSTPAVVGYARVLTPGMMRAKAREVARSNGLWLGRGRPSAEQIARCWRLRSIASGQMEVRCAGPPFEPGTLEVTVANAEGEIVWLEFLEPVPSSRWAMDMGTRRT